VFYVKRVTIITALKSSGELIRPSKTFFQILT